MKNIIFVAGLDDRDKKVGGNFTTPAPPGDLNLAQQTDLIIKGYGPGADIASFRYITSTATVTKSITDNPGAIIILFSAGCSKSKAIAEHLKSINQPLNLLHINEPYTCSANTANIVNDAIALGVPKTNVYSGGSDCTGNNISGHTKLVERTSHFQSLTPLGKLIASLKPPAQEATPATPAAASTPTPPPSQSKSVIATGPGKDFINKFNEELEKVYTKATTDLGPWKKYREDAIKIAKPRTGTWPVDPAVKTIGDLFAYVFFDLDGVNYKIPPYFVINNGVSPYIDEALKQQYSDWIDDMNGVSVSDPTISAIFKSLSWPYNNNGWTGDKRNSTNPITLSPSAKIIQNYTEIKKPGITNPDKYSAGQYWFDMFMSEVVGLNGLNGYLKSSKFVDDDPRYKGLHITWGSNNSRIEEIFDKDLLDNNSKIEKSFSYWGTIGDGTYSDPVYEDRKVYTMSVSKFAPNETIPRQGLTPHKYDRDNYSDYGTDEYPQDEGFAKILDKIDGGGYQGFDIRKFDGLKTQYRPGINSLESLSKDPLFNPRRTNLGDGSGEIDWHFAGTQSQAAGIYWEFPVGTTASVVGNFELILLYNAFLEAGDDYKTITIPKYEPKPKEEPPVTSTLTPTTESKFSGEFTFNVEKEKTFVVVGNQNFTLKIGDLVIEGLTTSSVIESPKTIDLGDGIIIIDDGESDEDIYNETAFTGQQAIDPEFDPIEFSIIKDLPKIDKEDSPENPNEPLPPTEQKTIKSTGTWTESKVTRLIKGSDWEARAANYIAKVESGSKAQLKSAWDVNAYRMGFGNDKIRKGGKVYDVTQSGANSTCTPAEAIDTLAYYGIQLYSDKIASSIGKSYWDKLTGNQKVALTSLGYNVGAYYITAREYGKKIKRSIVAGDMEAAANAILNGPQSADGKVLAGLVRRRKQEATLFLLPDNISVYGDGTV
jgi:GH24 family phage-related lysozyme (muramidase)